VSVAALLLQIASLTPRLQSGDPPALPPQAAAGGQAILELAVGAGGSVTEVRVLRDGPPFTTALRDAVKNWTFAAVEDAPARVLVAGVFRPPALFQVGPPAGEPSSDVAAASEDVPFPVQVASPAYPPKATGDGVVVLEAEVGVDGRLQRARVVRSAGAFDAPAIEALTRWMFRPARSGGRPVDATAYVVFGFRQPVTAPPRK
jgi:protein TonB